MIRNNLHLHFGLALLPLLLAASVASAANSFSNPLTGFTGDSTVPATQTAVADAGFNFFEFGDTVTKVKFDASGAKFGDGQLDSVGRNYVRTNDADYANVNFVAEITLVAPDIDIQDAYVGLGAGNANPDFFRTPDSGTPFSSVMFWGESEIGTPNIELVSAQNTTSQSVFIAPATGLGNGTHRMRLSYDRFRKAADFSFDLNYAGGAFMADVAASVNVRSLYGADGWPTEPARIYFGGDEGMVFKDFQVSVLTAPITLFGDFNNSGLITEADWAILRANQHANLSGLTQTAAYLRGDMTGDLANNHADFVAFKTLYETANGAGSFAAMLAGVPEPSSLVLIVSALLPTLSVRRRAASRA